MGKTWRYLLVLSIVGLLGLQLPPSENSPNQYNTIQITNLLTQPPLNNLTSGWISMVKITDAVDQSITLDTTKNGIRNIWFTGTYYYLADVSGNNGVIYRYNSSWASKTLVHSVSIYAYANTRSVAIPCIRVIDGTLHVIFTTMSFQTVMLGTSQIIDCTSADGTSWTDTTIWTSSALVYPIYACEINAIGTTPYYILQSVGNIIIDSGGTNYDDAFSGQTTGTYSDGTYLWFLAYASGTGYSLRKWSLAGGFVEDSAPTLSGGSDLALDTAQLWKYGDAYIAAWKNIVWYRESAVIGWKSISLTATYPAPHWYLDGTTLSVRSFTFGNVSVLSNGVDALLQMRLSTAHSVACAWDNYFVDTDKKVWKLEPVSQASYLTACTVATKPYSPPDCRLISTVEPLENEYLKLYTEADVEFYEGYVESYESKQKGEYVYIMRSPVEQELQRKVTVTYTNQKSHEILKSLLDTYCYFLWYDAGINTDPSTPYTITFENKTILEIIKWLDQQENYQTQIRPTLEVYRDTYTSSGLSWTENVDFPYKEEFTWTKKPLKLSIVKLIGGFSGSTRITAIGYGEANYGYYEDTMSHITNQTELDAAVASIIANKNKTIIRLHLDVVGKGIINYGLKVTITSSTYSISGDTYYVNASLYDAIQDSCELELSSALYLPSTKTNVITGSPAALQNQVDNAEHHIDDLYQDIGNTNARITSLATSSHAAATIGTANGLSIGGVSGQAISMARGTTSVVGTVQLEDSTSSTSTTKAATPNSVKTAYDLANGKENVCTASAPIVRTANDYALKNDASNTVTGIETTWTDSDVKIPTSKAMATKTAALISAASHPAVTIDGTSPLSLSTQAISIKNDAAAAITEVDTAAIIENSATKIPAESQLYGHQETFNTEAQNGHLNLLDRQAIDQILTRCGAAINVNGDFSGSNSLEYADFTVTHATVSNTTVAGHTKAIKLDYTGTSEKMIQITGITGTPEGYKLFSSWVYPLSTTVDFVLYIHNGDSTTATITFSSGGAIALNNAKAGGGSVAIGTYAANTLYHVAVLHKTANTSFVYLNGKLAASYTAAAAGGGTDAIDTIQCYTTEPIYIDVPVIGNTVAELFETFQPSTTLTALGGLPTTGGTLTGNLTIQKATPKLILKNATGTQKLEIAHEEAGYSSIAAAESLSLSTSGGANNWITTSPNGTETTQFKSTETVHEVDVVIQKATPTITAKDAGGSSTTLTLSATAIYPSCNIEFDTTRGIWFWGGTKSASNYAVVNHDNTDFVQMCIGKFRFTGWNGSANANRLVIADSISAAVNYLQITNAATTTPPILEAVGTDTNIDLKLLPKGTGGVLSVGDLTIQKATPTITAKDAGGSTTTLLLPEPILINGACNILRSGNEISIQNDLGEATATYKFQFVTKDGAQWGTVDLGQLNVQLGISIADTKNIVPAVTNSSSIGDATHELYRVYSRRFNSLDDAYYTVPSGKSHQFYIDTSPIWNFDATNAFLKSHLYIRKTNATVYLDKANGTNVLTVATNDSLNTQITTSGQTYFAAGGYTHLTVDRHFHEHAGGEYPQYKFIYYSAGSGAVAQGNILGRISFLGGTGSYGYADGAHIEATVLAATPSPTNMQSDLRFYTTPASSVTPELILIMASTGFYLRKNNVSISQLNATGSAYLDLIKLDGSNYLRIGAGASAFKMDCAGDFNANVGFYYNLYMKKSSILYGRNNADDTNLDILKVDASDFLQVGTGTTKTVLNNKLNRPPKSELTIASGVITPTGSYHRIDTEGDAASDDLDTITAGADGDLLILRTADAGRDVVIKNGTGNIFCGSDRTLSDPKDVIELLCDGTNWLLKSYADNA